VKFLDLPEIDKSIILKLKRECLIVIFLLINKMDNHEDDNELINFIWWRNKTDEIDEMHDNILKYES